MARPAPSPAALAGVALALGQCVQTVGAMPWVESTLPFLWQAPLISVSVANAVLFWVFVQALFDDEFVPRLSHVMAWFAVAALSFLNCTLAVTQGAWPLRGIGGPTWSRAGAGCACSSWSPA